MTKNITEEIKKSLRNTKATQKKIADFLNVSTKTIYNWKNGITNPKEEKIMDLQSFCREYNY